MIVFLGLNGRERSEDRLVIAKTDEFQTAQDAAFVKGKAQSPEEGYDLEKDEEKRLAVKMRRIPGGFQSSGVAF